MWELLHLDRIFFSIVTSFVRSEYTVITYDLDTEFILVIKFIFKKFADLVHIHRKVSYQTLIKDKNTVYPTTILKINLHKHSGLTSIICLDLFCCYSCWTLTKGSGKLYGIRKVGHFRICNVSTLLINILEPLFELVGC